MVGALTAFIGASTALVQRDIKKVLAYSTVSQLGYMFLGLSTGAWAAAVFHLVTHAFFKGLLFLGAGSVIHGMHEEQDMFRMGGLRRHMPTTFKTFVAGSAALSGLPLLSGFFSKDEILANAFATGGLWTVLWIVGLVAAAMTAFYTWRMVALTFFGEERFDAHKVHPHESPSTMTMPLVVLAVLSVFGGLLGLPHVFHVPHVLHGWLEPVTAAGDAILAAGHGGHEAHLSVPLEWALLALGSIVALFFAHHGFHGFKRGPAGDDWLRGKRPELAGFLERAWTIDATYRDVDRAAGEDDRLPDRDGRGPARDRRSRQRRGGPRLRPGPPPAQAGRRQRQELRPLDGHWCGRLGHGLPLVMNLLVWITFLPLAGALVLALVPGYDTKLLRRITLAVTGVVGLLGLRLWFGFDGAEADVQKLVAVPWFSLPGARAIDVQFQLGVDGLSILMVALTAVLMPIVVVSSVGHVHERVKEFLIWLLVMETGMLGVFLSLDLLLFYVFWEVSLVPLYFILGIWGGERRLYATLKFFLYTVAGSLVMLVGVIALIYGTGTTDLSLLLERVGTLSVETQTWIFFGFALAFAIKVPLLPFHTWLADAHTEAPTSGSVLLAGVLLKMGTYGLLRFCVQLFPGVSLTWAPLFMALGAIGIVYGAFLAMAQTDFKRLVACSSVSHLGFVVLGLFAMTEAGLRGSVLQMVNHGISTGMLFLLVGMIYERRHTRMLERFGGLASVMPIYAFFFVLTVLSSVGLPGLNGFVGEYLILLGSFQSSPLWASIGVTGVIFGAVYLLVATRRVLFGPIVHKENEGLADMNRREIGIMVPLAILALWIGVQPRAFLGKADGSLDRLSDRIEDARSLESARAALSPLAPSVDQRSEDVR